VNYERVALLLAQAGRAKQCRNFYAGAAAVHLAFWLMINWPVAAVVGAGFFIVFAIQEHRRMYKIKAEIDFCMKVPFFARDQTERFYGKQY
jgi:hypothetical protein